MVLKFTQQININETNEKGGFAHMISKPKSIPKHTLITLEYPHTRLTYVGVLTALSSIYFVEENKHPLHLFSKPKQTP